MYRAAVFALLVLAGCASVSYDPQKLVYTSDRRGFEQSELKPLFDRLLSGTEPVVLFVHGRGNEPGKSLKGTGFVVRPWVQGRAVSKLEAYGTKTVLFSWNSKRCGVLLAGLKDRQCPLDHIDEAGGGADRFKEVIDAVAASAAEHPSHPPLTLVAHSMGTIVVQRYIDRTHGWANGRKVFDHVVISSSDAAAENHAAWVETIAAVDPVFVTVNPSDPFLQKSQGASPPNAHPLGLDPGTPRAAHATYRTFDVGVHEIFTNRGERTPVVAFFDEVLKNQTPPAAPAP